METIQETLNNRAKTHGSYKDVAKAYQGLKFAITANVQCGLMPEERMALDMVAMKLARICRGAERTDSWHDIAGYATLAEQALTAKKEKQEN